METPRQTITPLPEGIAKESGIPSDVLQVNAEWIILTINAFTAQGHQQKLIQFLNSFPNDMRRFFRILQNFKP